VKLSIRSSPPLQCSPVAVFVDDGVGHHVVVMGERVQCPGREVPERRDRQSPGQDRLALLPSAGGVILEIVEAGVVARFDRVQHRPTGRGVAE
jgi:hypothetical protein